MPVKAKRSTKASPKKTTARASSRATKTTIKAKTKTNATAVKRVTSAVTEPMKKTQQVTALAERLDVPRKQASEVFAWLEETIERHVKKRACGEFTLPGICKIKVVRKPAKKARKGINPFTGEETTFKAKPAHNVVKIRPLKKLKEMVA